MGCGIGSRPPAGRGARPRFGGTWLDVPGVAAVFGLVNFMHAIVQRRIDIRGSVRRGSEIEALYGGHARLFKNGLLAPGFAAVGGDQEERIARRALQVGTRDPAVLEIDKLNLIESGSSYARVGLRPGGARVFRFQKE